MEIKYSEEVANLLRTKSVIKSANNFLKDPKWLNNAIAAFSMSDNTQNEALLKNINNDSKIEEVIATAFENISKINQIKEEVMNLRVYSDNACTFKNPVLKNMEQLNDPMEGLWNFRSLSYATVLIIQTLKAERLISACYTTGSSTNQKHMINNYSDSKFSWVEFNKRKFDDVLTAKGDVLFGYVSYNKTQLNELMRRIRHLLNINNKNKFRVELGIYAKKYNIYLALEIIFNLFYKWREMKSEEEYRAIKIGELKTSETLPGLEIIPVSVNFDDDKTHILGSKNPFYELTNDVKLALK